MDEAVGSDYSADKVRLAQEFVDNWVVSELLYHEAVRLGVDKVPEAHRTLERMRKRLIVGLFLSNEIYGEDSTRIGAEQIQGHFDSLAADFVLREDIGQISAVLFTDRDAANAFRSAILNGASWDSTLLKFQTDPLRRQQIVQALDRKYFTKSTLFPEALWKLARTLQKGQVSFAVKTDFGYYVIQTHGFKKQGELPDLDYVRDEIRERLALTQRKHKYDLLLENLRSRFPVEVDTDFADTTKTRDALQ